VLVLVPQPASLVLVPVPVLAPVLVLVPQVQAVVFQLSYSQHLEKMIQVASVLKVLLKTSSLTVTSFHNNSINLKATLYHKGLSIL
jgi:hypothetical protein